MTKDEIMAEEGRALPTDRATAAEPVVSALRDGIPSAWPKLPLWIDQRRKQFRGEFYNGPVVLDFPAVLKPDEIEDLDKYLALVLAGLRRTAQAIEARRAETTGSACESAVGPADAPEAIAIQHTSTMGEGE